MLRNILSIFAGFLLWTLLWLLSNAALAAAMPQAFRADGTTQHVGILMTILTLSVLFSLTAGYLAATLASPHRSEVALWSLALLQLAVGIFVQIQYWQVLPVWYHLSFLALLAPGIVVGGALRRRQVKHHAALA